MKYKTEILTGIRPTADLTVANYLGAVKPIVELQDQGSFPLVFVADIHALTDNEPSLVRKYIHGITADYIALGLDPKKTKIYLQSSIMEEVSSFTLLLSRHISVAELLRVPTLKDKLKNKRPETANALLLLYPTIMAADILINKTKNVPVGKDQVAHIELARFLAERFNKKYGDTLPLPSPLLKKSLRILSLKGEGKMSKSSPSGAIFLTEDIKAVVKKIKSAETAFEGVMNERLESHIVLAKELSKTEKEKEEIDTIIKEHIKGKPVMKDFKEALTIIVESFLKEFQKKRKEIIKNPSYLPSVLEEGAKIAKENAEETLGEVKKALRFT